jgi:hypothetical protein
MAGAAWRWRRRGQIWSAGWSRISVALGVPRRARGCPWPIPPGLRSAPCTSTCAAPNFLDQTESFRLHLRCVGWFGGGGPARAAAQVGQYDLAMSAVTTLGHQGNVRLSGAVAAQWQARFPGRTAGKPCLTLSGPASSGVPAGVVGTALACTLDLPRVVRDIDGYTEVDVDLLTPRRKSFVTTPQPVSREARVDRKSLHLALAIKLGRPQRAAATADFPTRTGTRRKDNSGLGDGWATCGSGRVAGIGRRGSASRSWSCSRKPVSFVT